MSCVIYKNNGDFHIHLSEESRNGGRTHIISLKPKRIFNEIRRDIWCEKALEIDIAVSEAQQSSFIEILKSIRFNETTRFNKNRVFFTAGEVQIDLDSYDLPEGKLFNIEIEGPTGEAIDAVTNNLFPDGLLKTKK